MNKIFSSAINGSKDADLEERLSQGANDSMLNNPVMPIHTEKTLELELKRKAKRMANPDSIFED